MAEKLIIIAQSYLQCTALVLSRIVKREDSQIPLS